MGEHIRELGGWGHGEFNCDWMTVLGFFLASSFSFLLWVKMSN